MELTTPNASVTRTVYVVSVSSAVAVPLISPVDVLNVIPAGKDASAEFAALRNAKARGSVPPVAVTGVNAEYAIFTVRLLAATAEVVDSAGIAVNEALCPVCATGVAPSVTDTVTLLPLAEKVSDSDERTPDVNAALVTGCPVSVAFTALIATVLLKLVTVLL